MTSNVGAEHILQGMVDDTLTPTTTNDGTTTTTAATGGRGPTTLSPALRPALSPAVQAKVMAEVRGSFRPEFLNRLSEIVLFSPLGNAQLR